MVVEEIGLVAGAFTTAALLPQVWKAFKTKSTRDVSLEMVIVLGIGVVFWLAYGLMKNDVPIIIANALTLATVIALLYLKIKHG
ncbi:SemiSWEET transporter [Candidatus Micrarchaeota archaeon]|nr:SemiSWEET transporter [Candidatus Micrarchaeota archaeon]